MRPVNLAESAGGHTVIEIAQPAPPFELEAADGGTITLGEAVGESAALVVFFSLDCRACEISFLFWDRMHEQYAEAGCPVVAICVDAQEHAFEFYERSGVSFPVLADPAHATARAYGIEVTPELFLIDASGRVVSAHSAFDRDSLNALSLDIATRLGVEAVAIGDGEAPAFSPGCVWHAA